MKLCKCSSPRNMGFLDSLFEDKCGNCEGDIVTKSKNLCTGCYHNDYNYGLGGDKGCWSFDSAKVVKRLAIDVTRCPPYDWDNAEPRMSCYNKKGMVYINAGVLDSRGYWRK